MRNPHKEVEGEYYEDFSKNQRKGLQKKQNGKERDRNAEGLE